MLTDLQCLQHCILVALHHPETPHLPPQLLLEAIFAGLQACPCCSIYCFDWTWRITDCRCATYQVTWQRVTPGLYRLLAAKQLITPEGLYRHALHFGSTACSSASPMMSAITTKLNGKTTQHSSPWWYLAFKCHCHESKIRWCMTI